MILMASGRDVTPLFDSYHPSHVWPMLDKFRIGKISEPHHSNITFKSQTPFYTLLKKRVEKKIRDDNVIY